jgi:hypothetical protein
MFIELILSPEENYGVNNNTFIKFMYTYNLQHVLFSGKKKHFVYIFQ